MNIIDHHHTAGFRSDINALRALAVLGVLFFHFKAGGLQGGFAGVDIFFVISGYLMTKIILNDINKGIFSVKEFYVRRLKRIVPALIVLVIVTTIIGYCIYFPEDYKQMQKNALSSLFFVSNIYYLTNTSYFDPSADLNAFLHTWSLSVEWQFYLLYPFILMGLLKLTRKRNKQLWMFTALTILLYIAAIIVTKYYRSASFYLLPTRCWEMLAGGIAFLAEGYFKRKRLNQALALIGYILLIACFILLTGKVSWPGRFTCIPVVATLLILCANVNHWKMLNLEPVQFFGKISYSLYIWHWPVCVVAHYLGIHTSVVSIICLFTISTVLGTLSYSYIESVRYRSGFKIVQATTAMGLVALTLAFSNTNVWLFNERALQLHGFTAANKDSSHQHFSFGTCFVSEGASKANKHVFKKDSCMQIDARKKNVLLIGDSHAAHFSQSFREFFDKRNVNVLQATATSCFPFSTPNGDPDGYKVMSYVYHEFLVKHSDNVDGIIISAAWHNDSFQEMSKTLAHLNETLNYLCRFNKKVIVLGQSEAYSIPFPTIHAKEIQYRVKLRHKYFDAYAHRVNKEFKAQLPHHYVELYDINSAHVLSKDGTPYMFDKDHYSKYGADVTIANLMKVPTFKNFVEGL